MDGLWIYVGMQWRAWYKDWWRGLAEEEREAWRAQPPSGRRQDRHVTDEQHRVLGRPEVVRAGAHPAAHLPGPSRLQDVLESGRFRVAGSVYFAPLQPFNPEARVPQSPEEAFERTLSFDRFDYTYSEGQP